LQNKLLKEVSLSIYLQRKKMAFNLGLKLLICIAVLSFAVFLSGFFIFVKQLPVKQDIPLLSQTKFDGAVIFTGGKYRLKTMALIIKNGFKGPVLISGVFPGTSVEQTVKMLGLNSQQQNQIQLDFLSISTAGNAKQTFQWIKSNSLNSVLLVTSYYHIPRAKLLLNRYNRQNINVVAYPVFSNSTNLKVIFSEYIKYLLFKFSFIASISLKKQFPY
jgi:uncharacterized SAM-binding protein YcdF (DUF218 family)